MRRAAKVDGNHAEIVKIYCQLGCSVFDASSLGDGFPDIVVGCAGKTALVEIKDPSQPPSKRQLTPAQHVFHRDWRGDVRVVMTSVDVVAHHREMLTGKKGIK